MLNLSPKISHKCCNCFMRLPLPARAELFSLNAYHWFRTTPNRALDRAYKAALAIKKIEDENFSGNKIGTDSNQSPSVTAYFQNKLNALLRTARWRLVEFRTASAIVSDADLPFSLETRSDVARSSPLNPDSQTSYNSQQLLNKLVFVDRLLARYAEPEPQIIDLDAIQAPQTSVDSTKSNEAVSTGSVAKSESIFSKSGILPRSILRTGRRLQRELSSNSDMQVLQEFQLSRRRTKTSIRFLLVLIIVPLLVQQISKNFVFSPIIDHFQKSDRIEIALNSQMEHEAIEEIEFFEKKIKFEAITGQLPHLSSEKYEEMVEKKTLEVAKDYSHESENALKNILADLLSLGAFAWILFISPQQIQILKAFIDELIYGLSDSAKAFLIILFTDVFVGFHSTHGWEVLLEGILHHFGLPENRNYIYLFIATFPVVLDAIFKYWIFRYLSRISPSAVATYRNMNE